MDIIFRFQDPDDYVVALYNPAQQAIYFHGRKDGQWRDRPGRVDVSLSTPHRCGGRKYQHASGKARESDPCDFRFLKIGCSFSNLLIGSIAS